MLTGIFYKMFGVRVTFVYNFILSAIGGILLWKFGDQYEDYTTIFVLFAKFGVSATFTLLYITNNRIFPTLFITTAIGICDSVARPLAATATLVNELTTPDPMSIFAVLAIFAAVASCFLKPLSEYKDKSENEKDKSG